MKTIPNDVMNDTRCKVYTERTPGGALICQFTREDDPRDTKGCYHGAWVDTTEQQYAKEHDGKTKGARRNSEPKEKKVSKEEELAKAQALLAALGG